MTSADEIPAGPSAPGPTVTTLRDGPVSTIRLNRPEALNALDSSTQRALLDALVAAAEDPSVRCVVLTGSGRSFCVGQDLREHPRSTGQGNDALWRTVPERYNPIAWTLATMPKPVIAAVNGIAAGAGAAFALAADLRVFAAGAGMNFAFAGVGLSADSGTTWWLPRLVGPTRAKTLLLRPRTLDARECQGLGLADEVVPDTELTGRVRELAEDFAAGPTVAYGAIRQSVVYSCGHDLDASLAHEARMIRRTSATSDHDGAVAAFLDKRPARFEGR
jgi:2-(1,2-epoxy-1,2-dihydrophenyl)acetyl-CoA isomerase